jgi:hypothetical protein
MALLSFLVVPESISKMIGRETFLIAPHYGPRLHTLVPVGPSCRGKNDERFGHDHENGFDTARRETRTTSYRNLSRRAFARALQADAIVTIANDSKSFSSAPHQFPTLPVYRVPGCR